MDKQTKMKIISASAGALCLISGVVALALELEAGQSIVVTGLAILAMVGGLGTVAAPRLNEPRTPEDES